jgi:hypothetical protein
MLLHCEQSTAAISYCNDMPPIATTISPQAREGARPATSKSLFARHSVSSRLLASSSHLFPWCSGREKRRRGNITSLQAFKNTIDNLQLAPLELLGRRFTWCNDQPNPTMTRIDHFLASAEWLEIFPRRSTGPGLPGLRPLPAFSPRRHIL